MPVSGIVAFKPATIAAISCALQRRNTFGQVFLLVPVGFAARRCSYRVVPKSPKIKPVRRALSRRRQRLRRSESRFYKRRRECNILGSSPRRNYGQMRTRLNLRWSWLFFCGQPTSKNDQSLFTDILDAEIFEHRIEMAFVVGISDHTGGSILRAIYPRIPSTPSSLPVVMWKRAFPRLSAQTRACGFGRYRPIDGQTPSTTAARVQGIALRNPRSN